MIETFKGITYHIDPKEESIGQIGLISGDIFVSPKFNDLNDLTKEIILNHLLYMRERNGDLFKADEDTFKYMFNKYPDLSKGEYLSIMNEIVDKSFDENIRRYERLEELLEKIEKKD